MWIACLEHRIEALKAGRPTDVLSVWLASKLRIQWKKRYFERFVHWHERVVARQLQRDARQQALVALTLEYVSPTFHGSAVLRFVQYRRGAPSPRASAVRDDGAKQQQTPRATVNVQANGQAPKDDEAIDLEEARFKARFGFYANPTVRAQVYKLKAAHNFTDAEIRYLKRTGALTVRGDLVVCRPSVALFLTGCVLLVPLAALLFHGLVRFYQLPSQRLLALTITLAVLLIYIGIGWLVWWQYCRPYLFLKRRMAVATPVVRGRRTKNRRSP